MKSFKSNSRRSSLLKSTAFTTGAISLGPIHGFSASQIRPVSVGQIMDTFISQVPNGPFSQTVDTLKTGSKDQVVTGVVTSMFATIAVIRQAIELNANFIIAHEPTFYNHLDETEWLENDQVFEFKRNLLKENEIAVWRNHDYVHRLAVDGVQAGVVNELGWNEYYNQNAVLNIPSTTLGDLIADLKIKLKVDAMRYVGDLNQSISKVLLLPGAVGGRRHIEEAMKEKLDVIIVGESPEWETPEYVRNANEMGEKLSLVVIGHSANEEGGSEFLAGWMRETFPELPVHHIPSGNSLKSY